MKSKFKVGDKVKCINIKNMCYDKRSWSDSISLYIGQILIIQTITSKGLMFEGGYGQWTGVEYRPSAFKLVKSTAIKKEIPKKKLIKPDPLKAACFKCAHEHELRMTNSFSPCWNCKPFSKNPSGFRDKKLPPIPDIEQVGIYRAGLTGEEIKKYITDFYFSMTDAQKEKFLGFGLKKENYNISPDILYVKFCNVSGVNTQGVITIQCEECKCSKMVSLMYRHDVERYTKKMFFRTQTCFD
jgi:hypothetical protein